MYVLKACILHWHIAGKYICTIHIYSVGKCYKLSYVVLKVCIYLYMYMVI